MLFLDGFLKCSEQEVCPVWKAKILAIVLLLFLALYGTGTPLKRIANDPFWVAMSQHMVLSVLAAHKALGANHLEDQESHVRGHCPFLQALHCHLTSQWTEALH